MLEAGTGHNGDTNLNMMGAERDICRDVDIISMHPALDLGILLRPFSILEAWLTRSTGLVPRQSESRLVTFVALPRRNFRPAYEDRALRNGRI